MKASRALSTVAAVGFASLALGGMSPAHADTNGCPSGYVCIYPSNSWGTPTLKFYNYGATNLSNVVGTHRVFNNQTGGAIVQLCTAYNGGGCGASQAPGWYADVDLTPINSVNLAAQAPANNQTAAFNFFRSIGYTRAQSAGVVGNLMQESGTSVNPRASQPGGPGRGIAQWSVGDRWDTLVSWAQGRGEDPWALQTQLEFIQHELDTQGWLGKSQLTSATTVYDATVAFEDNYERCGDCQTSTRVSYATQVYNAHP